MELDAQTKVFLKRIAHDLAGRGLEPTESHIEAAMRRVLKRDAELVIAVIDESELGVAIKDSIAKSIYESARSQSRGMGGR